MKKKRGVKTTLTILPQNPRPKRVPKPQVKADTSSPLSMRGAKARVKVNVPGVKD